MSPNSNTYHIWLLGDHKEGGEKWEHLCIEYRSWPDADRVLLLSECLTALEIYPRGGGDVKDKKIMFATGACEVFTVHLDGGDTRPEIIFSPDDGTAIAGGCEENDHRFPMVGLVEESLVSVGRTGDEIIFSSLWRKAWSDVLKWLPAPSLPPLDLVCRDWHAVIKSDRFTRLHAAAHAGMGKSHR